MLASSPWIFVTFFIGLFAFFIITSDPNDSRQQPIEDAETLVATSSTSTSTNRGFFSFLNFGNNTNESGDGGIFRNTAFIDESPVQQTPTETLTRRELEEELEDSFEALEDLEEEIRINRLWGTRSPFETQITLLRGNVNTEDPEREYLRLRASSRNEKAIDISGWLLESYVTGKGASIPFGSKVFRRGRVNTTNPILLQPGEEAFLVTGESPIGASFQENSCTGYLTERQTFIPSTSRSCPRPLDELEDFGRILLDNDECYEFIEDIRICEIPDNDEIEEADLDRGCVFFIREHLNYNDCVDNHSFEPFFSKGDWYIYFERDENEEFDEDEIDDEDDIETNDLWREEREIIRLFDRQGRTISVIEY